MLCAWIIPKTSYSSQWEKCLPWNQPLMPKWLGTTGLYDTDVSLLPVSLSWPALWDPPGSVSLGESRLNGKGIPVLLSIKSFKRLPEEFKLFFPDLQVLYDLPLSHLHFIRYVFVQSILWTLGFGIRTSWFSHACTCLLNSIHLSNFNSRLFNHLYELWDQT